MSLRRFVLLLGCVLFVLVLGVVYLVSRFYIVDSFSDFEQTVIHRSLDRSMAVFDHRLATLATFAHDWAEWDESYAYMATGDPGYERANLVPESLQALQINFILFFDDQGALFLSRGLDASRSHPAEVSEDVIWAVRESPLLSFAPEAKGSSGMLAAGGAVYLVTSHVILSSNGQGEPRGVLAMGRMLDQDLIASMERETIHELQLTTLGSAEAGTVASFLPRKLEEGQEVTVSLGETITAYGLLDDVHGEPVVLMAVSMSRDIHAQGQRMLHYLFATVVLCGGVVFAGMGLVLERKVLARITQIGRQTARIANEQDPLRKVAARGNDELARLAGDINAMLDELDRGKEALEQRVEERTGELVAANERLLLEIEERERIGQTLREREQHIKAIFENMQTGILLIDPDSHTIVDVNPLAAKLIGMPPEELKGRECFERICPARKGACPITDLGQDLDNSERLLLTADGRELPIQKTVTRVEINGREYLLESFIDIHKHKEAEEALLMEREFFTQLFEKSPMAIAVIDPSEKVVNANKGFMDVFGYRPEELVGRRLRDLIIPKEFYQEAEFHRQAVQEGQTIIKDTRRKHKNGYPVPVSILGYPVVVQGRMAGYLFSYRDISEQVMYEAQLSHKAFYDELTGLPNRSLFFERLKRAIVRGQRNDSHYFAVLMLDLDRFKEINDSLGHQMGDRLLSEVALRLSSCVRETDTVARLGGDEFAIIMEEFKIPQEVVNTIRRIQKELKRPFEIVDSTIHTSSSIGVVLNTKTYALPEDILRDADIAMYKAKRRRDDFQIFNRSMFEKIREMRNLEADMRDAVINNQLVLHYQPIISVESGRIIGFETLLRWKHASEGMLPPYRFIPVAEDSGLIIPMGQWVIREACRQLRQWNTTSGSGLEQVSLSVNISGKQFRQPDLPDFIRRTLAEYGLPPERLKVEITESIAMEDVDRTRNMLSEFKEIGLTVLIDDFGTGYSSLSYLQQFPIDFLKIDRSFISGSVDKKESQEIIRAIVALARALGLRVVAEGVETPEQFQALRDLRCDEAQGFMISRPLPVEQAEALFRTGVSF